jgi:hypothetical protein
VHTTFDRLWSPPPEGYARQKCLPACNLETSPKATPNIFSKNKVLYTSLLLLLYFSTFNSALRNSHATTDSSLPRLYPTLRHDDLANHSSALACMDMVLTCPSWRGEGGSIMRVDTHIHGARKHQPFYSSGHIHMPVPTLAVTLPHIGWRIRKRCFETSGASGRGDGGHHAVSLKPSLGTVTASGFSNIWVPVFFWNGAKRKSGVRNIGRQHCRRL